MKILVAIDSSDFAEEVLRQIAKRTWPDDSRFLLVTIVDVHGKDEIDQPAIHQAQVILDHRVLGLARQLPNEVTGEVIEGNANAMILSTARSWNADLIVLGSHGDTGVRKDRLGSVAAAVVNEAPCSVEVIKLHRTCGTDENQKKHVSAHA